MEALKALTKSSPTVFLDAKCKTTPNSNVAGRLKQWLRYVFWRKLRDYYPISGMRMLKGLSAAGDCNVASSLHEATPHSRTSSYDGWDKGDASRDYDAGYPSDEVSDNFVEDVYCRGSDASQGSRDGAKAAKGYNVDHEGPLLERLDWWPSHRYRDDGGLRSGAAAWDMSEIKNSDASKEMCYLAFSEDGLKLGGGPNFRSFDQSQQDASFSTVAALAPGLVSAVEPAQSPLQSLDVSYQLLDACQKREAVTFFEILQQLGVENCMRLHQSEHVDVFVITGARFQPTVLKIFDSSYIAQHIQCLCKEINISWSLKALAKRAQNQTSGFSQLQEAHCTWERYPELLVDACDNYLSKQDSTASAHGARKLFPPYIVLRIPFAGRELSKVKFENTLQLRSVVQQVALTIAVGEAELEFEHRALAIRHVLVKAARGRVALFRVMNNAVYVDLHGIKTTVVDIAASRLCAGIGSMPIYTDLSELSEDKKRGVGERLALIRSTIRRNASRVYPYTNAVFLHDLIHELLEAYEPIFEPRRPSWTEPEREAWRDLTLWSEEIPGCSSALDFVVARVVRSVRLDAVPDLEDDY